MKTAHNIFCCVVLCLLALFIFPITTKADSTYETIQIEIPIDCREVDFSDNHIYRITIEAVTERAPLPNESTISICENEEGFFILNLNEPGTYIYRMYEPKGTEEYIEYCSHIYEATVFVEANENDELFSALSVTIDGNDTKTDELHFQDYVLSGGERKTLPSTTATTSLSTSETTTTSTTFTTAVTTSEITTSSTKSNPIVEFVDGVMTGDNMPIRLLVIIIAAATVLMISAMIFKKKED